MNRICECNRYIECFPPGTLDLSPCLDVFVLGSLPHFYLADPKLRDTMMGMDPNEALHKTGIYFDLVCVISFPTQMI